MLAELTTTGSLVTRFVLPTASRAVPESADLVRRCCAFLDAAIAVDAGGQLARELTPRLSDGFLRSAAEIYDATDGPLRHIINERLRSSDK